MVATRTPPLRPAVRLRPVPPLDPPFADDPASGLWVSGRQLHLDLAGAHRHTRRHRAGWSAPARPFARPLDATTDSTPGTPGTPPPAEALATATPDATRAAQRFITTCLEILNGFRPVAQIRPLIVPTQAVSIIEQLTTVSRRLGPLPRRATRPGMRLRRLRVCEPRPGAAEGAAAVDSPTGRTWAIAFRLERRRGAWVSTVLRVL